MPSPDDPTGDETGALRTDGQQGRAGPVRETDAVQRTREAILAWKAVVAKYQQPNAWRASWQLLNTIGTYVGLWCLMYFTVGWSWWLTIPLAVLAGGLLVRVFIIFHDCGHGSFLASRTANDFWGFVTGVLTFTPYYHWRGEHAVHHGAAGDLDRRGTGDVWTMTVQEYVASSSWKRVGYRFVRNPIVLFGIAPLVFFLVLQRIPRAGASRRERWSVWGMTVTLLGVAVGMCAVFGVLHYVLIQLVIMLVAGSGGIWLFYLQHQFEDAYWERGDDWDYAAAALKGSSFYRLPRILQWFSGNIGFHHVHHLSPRIPNYNLERCHRADPMFQAVPPITLLSSLRSLGLRLWDESSKKLVGFRHLQKLRERNRGGNRPDKQ